MKIYIATRFTNTKEFHELREKLEANGHTITHDWTNEDATKVPKKERAEYLDRCARADLDGVERCDVFVLIAHPNMAGAFVELGYAISACKQIVIIGAEREGVQDCIFYHIIEPGHLILSEDPDEVVDLLTKAERCAKVMMELLTEPDDKFNNAPVSGNN